MRLLIVEPIQLNAQLWQSVLSDEPPIAHIGAITSLTEAESRLDDCDVILLGTSLNHDQALAFTTEAAASHPDLKIIVLGVPKSEPAVLRLVEAGAAGLVLRNESIADALAAVRAACSGEARIDPDLAPVLMARLAELRQAFNDPDTEGRRYQELSPREREVLDFVARGMTNRQIADQLVIEVGTVKNHVHSILEKLQMRSRYEAADYLRSLGPHVSS